MTTATLSLGSARGGAAYLLLTSALLLGGCHAGGNRAGGFDLPPRGSLFAPKGSPWTILCLEVRGPDRVQQIEQIAEVLRHTPGIDARRVVVQDESDEVVRLYYGLYFRRTDPDTGRPSTPERLATDINLIKQLGAPGSDPKKRRYFFFYARTVRVPLPNVGNPEWSLDRVNATYTLQVGVFEPTDDFWDVKQAAAETCASLRRRGFEAYYYHDEAASMVTVGAFGTDAVIKPSVASTQYDAQRDTLRIPMARYGPEVIALQQEELLRYNRVNGRIYYKKGEGGRKFPILSQLVEVPGKAAESW